MDGKVGEILGGMAGATDLEGVLGRVGVGVVEALEALEGEEGVRQRAARRALARIHVEMLAYRYGALAMVKLGGLLSEADAGLRMKGAVAVLGAMKTEARSYEDTKTHEEKKGIEEVGEDIGEGAGFLEAVAEVMAERRRVALMGEG